jgi:hypothetical protein
MFLVFIASKRFQAKNVIKMHPVNPTCPFHGIPEFLTLEGQKILVSRYLSLITYYLVLKQIHILLSIAITYLFSPKKSFEKQGHMFHMKVICIKFKQNKLNAPRLSSLRLMENKRQHNWALRGESPPRGESLSLRRLARDRLASQLKHLATFFQKECPCPPLGFVYERFSVIRKFTD